MTNEIEEDEKEQVSMVPAEARISFARKNDLAKVMRKIDKSVDKAIEFLEQVMLDVDADPKQRVDAAKFIVDRKIQISDNISKDQLARCIAESRLVLATQATQQKRIKNVTDDGDEDDATPRYMPSVILDHSSLREM